MDRCCDSNLLLLRFGSRFSDRPGKLQPIQQQRLQVKLEFQMIWPDPAIWRHVIVRLSRRVFHLSHVLLLFDSSFWLGNRCWCAPSILARVSSQDSPFSPLSASWPKSRTNPSVKSLLQVGSCSLSASIGVGRQDDRPQRENERTRERPLNLDSIHSTTVDYALLLRVFYYAHTHLYSYYFVY